MTAEYNAEQYKSTVYNVLRAMSKQQSILGFGMTMNAVIILKEEDLKGNKIINIGKVLGKVGEIYGKSSQSRVERNIRTFIQHISEREDEGHKKIYTEIFNTDKKVSSKEFIIGIFNYISYNPYSSVYKTQEAS